MVKFNENMQPIFGLLMQVENLKLSHEILEPEPTDFKRFLFECAHQQPHSTAYSYVTELLTRNHLVIINRGVEKQLKVEDLVIIMLI